MANEYRIFQNNAEVIWTGDPDAPIRIYQVSVEVIRTIADAPPPPASDRRRNFMSFSP